MNTRREELIHKCRESERYRDAVNWALCFGVITPSFIDTSQAKVRISRWVRDEEERSDAARSAALTRKELGIRSGYAVPLELVDKNGEIIETYKSIADASIKLRVSNWYINRLLMGERPKKSMIVDGATLRYKRKV